MQYGYYSFSNHIMGGGKCLRRESARLMSFSHLVSRKTQRDKVSFSFFSHSHLTMLPNVSASWHDHTRVVCYLAERVPRCVFPLFLLCFVVSISPRWANKDDSVETTLSLCAKDRTTNLYKHASTVFLGGSNICVNSRAVCLRPRRSYVKSNSTIDTKHPWCTCPQRLFGYS